MIMPAMAQNTYYYYYDTPIALVEDTTRFVVFSPPANNAPASISSLGGTLIDSSTNERFSMQVYSRDPAMPMSKVRSQLSETQSVQVRSCYLCDGVSVIPNAHIFVKLKEDTDYSILEKTAQEYNCEIIGQDPFMPLWYELLAGETAEYNSVEIAKAMHESGLFQNAYPSLSGFQYFTISYDEHIISQWNLYNSVYKDIDISVSGAWNYATGRGVKIAIVDSGIDMSHKDLINNIHPKSYDAYTNTTPSKVYSSHGTHCAGIAAAERNNKIGIAGVAPDARLMSVSCPPEASNALERLGAGINWASLNGAEIISCSWGTANGNANTYVSDAIRNVVLQGREGKGCIVVCAAGNYNKGQLHRVAFPARMKEVIAVSSISIDGQIASNSCYGDEVFVTAPGDPIYSTVPGGYESQCGTSMAAPHVAGVAALILERNNSLTAAQVKEIIAKSATKIGNIPFAIRSDKKHGGWNEKYGYGLVNAQRAMELTPVPITMVPHN